MQFDTEKKKGERTTRGFSDMLASEHILIDITLISYSPIFTNITELWNILSAFYLYPDFRRDRPSDSTGQK